MLPNLQALNYPDLIGMDGLPNYWGDLNHRQELAQGALPLLDTNLQLTLWVPLCSPQAPLAPVLFQRANTAPVQYSTDPTVNPYDLSASTNGHAWGSPAPSLQRSLSDPAWSHGSEVPPQAQRQDSPDDDDPLPKKALRKERRRSQNRKAQRAFRERKESRLRELEEELARVNAKYNALANDHRHITTQLMALMAEKQELFRTVLSPVDACSPLSPEAGLGSRLTSVADEDAEGLLNGMGREEGNEVQEPSPQILTWATNLPPDVNS